MGGSKISDLKVDLENAFNSVGESMMSEDYACKLLAWLLQYGGHYEAVVHNPNLNADIRIAQKKANVFGGQVPNEKLMKQFQIYNRQLKIYKTKLDWAQNIFKKYNLEIPKD